MKPIFIYLITVSILLVILLVGDRVFKLQHSEKESYHLQNFKLNDTIFVDDAIVFTGKNIFGVQEAILIPGPGAKTLFTYMYIRFSPEWFDANLKRNLKRGYPDHYQGKTGLLNTIKRWHRDNIKRFSHINDLPTFAPAGFVPVLIYKGNKEH